MKKTIPLLLALILLLALPACGESGARPNPTPAIPASAAISIPTPAPIPGAAPTADPAAAEVRPAVNPAPGAVDVDLTQLSSTMIYSEVYAMVYAPEQYTGKTVKMRGLFATQEYNGARLYACVVQDATACCAQGLEFELAEALVYPDDYPEPGTEITVVGTFDSYREEHDGNDYLYLVLRDARFV